MQPPVFIERSEVWQVFLAQPIAEARALGEISVVFPVPGLQRGDCLWMSIEIPHEFRLIRELRIRGSLHVSFSEL